MLRRSAYERLERWRAQPGRRALLIDGARQVGKTYLVRAFARAHYDLLVEINFIDQPEIGRAHV